MDSCHFQVEPKRLWSQVHLDIGMFNIYTRS